MSFHLVIQEKFDVFYFNQNLSDEQIEFNFPINCSELINYLQASLSQKKCVFIVNDKKEISKLNLDKCSAKHCLINKDNYLFLNISIRNHLKNISNFNTTFESYHQVEEFFSSEMQNII